jgi:hypothetical protein
MEKREIEFATRLTRADVAGLIEALIEGLKDGKLKIKKSSEELELDVPRVVDLEIEASIDDERAEFEIEVSWRTNRTGPRIRICPLIKMMTAKTITPKAPPPNHAAKLRPKNQRRKKPPQQPRVRPRAKPPREAEKALAQKKQRALRTVLRKARRRPGARNNPQKRTRITLLR